eukprot:g73653.t1
MFGVGKERKEPFLEVWASQKNFFFSKHTTLPAPAFIYGIFTPLSTFFRILFAIPSVIPELASKAHIIEFSSEFEFL